MNFRKSKRLKSFALWVKENQSALSIIGSVFFAFALIFGFMWLTQSDDNRLEPITFVLSTCSSIFFGLPTIAEFILPSRKPIRHMTYDELIEFIQTTDSARDWYSVDRELIQERFLKEDPRLRINAKLFDEGIENEDFQETWANQHPNPKAVSHYYNILFDGNFIHRLILVQVDGGRAILPLPNLHTMKPASFDYKIAQIFDSTQSLEKYMAISGILV